MERAPLEDWPWMRVIDSPGGFMCCAGKDALFWQRFGDPIDEASDQSAPWNTIKLDAVTAESLVFADPRTIRAQLPITILKTGQVWMHDVASAAADTTRHDWSKWAELLGRLPVAPALENGGLVFDSAGAYVAAASGVCLPTDNLLGWFNDDYIYSAIAGRTVFAAADGSTLRVEHAVRALSYHLPDGELGWRVFFSRDKGARGYIVGACIVPDGSDESSIAVHSRDAGGEDFLFVYDNKSTAWRDMTPDQSGIRQLQAIWESRFGRLVILVTGAGALYHLRKSRALGTQLIRVPFSAPVSSATAPRGVILANGALVHLHETPRGLIQLSLKHGARFIGST